MAMTAMAVGRALLGWAEMRGDVRNWRSEKNDGGKNDRYHPPDHAFPLAQVHVQLASSGTRNTGCGFIGLDLRQPSNGGVDI